MGQKALYKLHKPFGLLSQFTDEGHKQGLGSLGLPFDKDVYPIGRLDADSEGLLLLTNDNRLKTRMLDPKRGTHADVPCAGGRAGHRRTFGAVGSTHGIAGEGKVFRHKALQGPAHRAHLAPSNATHSNQAHRARFVD